MNRHAMSNKRSKFVLLWLTIHSLVGGASAFMKLFTYREQKQFSFI
jgi:hypothetical protein